IFGWLNFLGQAIFVQILGQGLVIYGLSKIRPQLSSLLLLFQPITATILGAYFFSETLLIGQLIGVIILLLGIYLAGLSERLREIND
ncbi:DMT family transporter, partial [SAR86 cluster bacterium]|nr:DMT family transporter [SAR86 cluster bacterium]